MVNTIRLAAVQSAPVFLDLNASLDKPAKWSSHFNLGNDMQEIIMITSRSIGYRLKAYVINAVGEVSAAMREQLPLKDEHRSLLDQ